LLFDRSSASDSPVRERTAELIARVRRDGDVTLRSLAKELDGVTLESLEVPKEAWVGALNGLSPALRGALDRAAANIRCVHQAFVPAAHEVESEPGIVVGRRPDPLGRVGVYAPGGRAAYPSSVLMGVIPARVAGVSEIVICSPPERAT
jgi:histidinol dehydrogenase